MLERKSRFGDYTNVGMVSRHTMKYEDQKNKGRTQQKTKAQRQEVSELMKYWSQRKVQKWNYTVILRGQFSNKKITDNGDSKIQAVITYVKFKT